MKFNQLYSSSTSNLYTVTAGNGKRLLIEAGVPWKKLEKAINYDLSNIEGCLLSHCHLDHSKAVLDVMKAGINVYSSEGTFAGCGILNGQRRARIVKPRFTIAETFDILSFRTIHDAAEPLGFVIHETETGENLLFATDTAYIRQRFTKIRFNIIALECSYDRTILLDRVERNDINETVAKRLLDSHQEKQVAIDYIDKYCDLKKCREIHLLHMSSANLASIKETAKEFERRFFVKTITGRSKSHDVP